MKRRTKAEIARDIAVFYCDKPEPTVREILDTLDLARRYLKKRDIKDIQWLLNYFMARPEGEGRGPAQNETH